MFLVYINEREKIKYPISFGKDQDIYTFFFFFFFFLSSLSSKVSNIFLTFHRFPSRSDNFSRFPLSLSFSPCAIAFPRVPFFSLSPPPLPFPLRVCFRRIFLGSPIFYHVSLVILGTRTCLFLLVLFVSSRSHTIFPPDSTIFSPFFLKNQFAFALLRFRTIFNKVL